MFKNLSCIKYSCCFRNPNHHGEYTERDVSVIRYTSKRYVIKGPWSPDSWMRKHCNNEQPQHFGISHIFTVSVMCLSSTHQNLKVHIIPWIFHTPLAGHGILPRYLCPACQGGFLLQCVCGDHLPVMAGWRKPQHLALQKALVCALRCLDTIGSYLVGCRG